MAIENGLKQIRYRIGELRWHEYRQCPHMEKPLWQLIDESRAAEANDPRDKVYGLFALLPHSITERIPPSYDPNFTVADCYVMFAKTCVEVQGNLNLLARLSGTTSGLMEQNLASWAFDSHTLERNQLKVTTKTQGQDPRLALARVLTNNAIYDFTDYPSLLNVPWATLVKQAEELGKEESYRHKNWSDTVRNMSISAGTGEMEP